MFQLTINDSAYRLSCVAFLAAAVTTTARLCLLVDALNTRVQATHTDATVAVLLLSAGVAMVVGTLSIIEQIRTNGFCAYTLLMSISGTLLSAWIVRPLLQLL